MALKPEPMQRTVIVSSKGYQKTIIETLHSLNIAHINAVSYTHLTLPTN